MRVLRGDPANWSMEGEGSVVTVGVFDGVHLGHQQIGASLLDEAAKRGGLSAGVVTFDRHPLATIEPGSAPALITTVEEQLEIWEEIGMEFVAVMAFNATMREMSPAEFVKVVLSNGLLARHVVVGSGFRFGRDGAGDAAELERLGKELGFSVEAQKLLELEESAVSSTLIRAAIADGDMDTASTLLGRPFSRTGTVVPGANRGAEIGFATANLAIASGLAIPGRGVYAAVANLEGERWSAVVNIGTRPTFEGTDEVVEAHLLDFEQDIYGRTLVLEFVRRLRGERHFESVEELVAQIGTDVASARALLAGD